jgi:hypothetical protein
MACENGRLRRLHVVYHNGITARERDVFFHTALTNGSNNSRMSRVVYQGFEFPVNKAGEMGPRQAGRGTIAAQGSTCADITNTHAADVEVGDVPR